MSAINRAVAAMDAQDLRTLFAVSACPLWACRVVRANVARHQDGTPVRLAVIAPGYR